MMEVVQAKPEHAQRVLEIFRQAKDYKVRHGDSAWGPGFSEKGVKHLIRLGSTYVAFQGEEAVGTIALEWEDKEGWDDLEKGNAGYISRLAVGDSARGQATGKQIIEWAASQVLAKNRLYLRLDCSPDNKQLCTYYESQGFRQIRTKQFPEFNYLAALYQKPLK